MTDRPAARFVTTLMIVCPCLVLACGGDDSSAAYTINGQSLNSEQATMLAEAGIPDGGYWLDADGHFGVDGEPVPMFRLDWEDLEDSGPWPVGAGSDGQVLPSAAEPASSQVRPEIATRRAAPTRVQGVDGTRLFWIQTSVLSNSGASGYVHFCPGGVIYTSSEGSFSVGGGGGWAGGAFTDNASGRWTLIQRDGYPFVNVEYGDGTTEGYWVSDLTRGSSWRSGQYKFAAEQGRASCS